jgi:hypothetical protein
VLDADAAGAEIVKLAETALAAESEMRRGAENLRVAARRLRSIESQTYSMDNKASTLLGDLRVFSGKDAVELRDTVASTVDQVTLHRSAARSTLQRIFRSGIEV